jgi:hypothetical protein
MPIHSAIMLIQKIRKPRSCNDWKVWNRERIRGICCLENLLKTLGERG